MTNEKSKSTALGILAIFLWATTVAVARSCSEHFGTIPSALCVYGLGGIFLALVDFLIKGTTPLEVIKSFTPWYLLICSVLFAINNVCFYLAIGFAVDINTVLGVSLVNYTWPTTIILFSLLILKKKASPLLALGVLLSSLGVFLVITQNTNLDVSSLVESISNSKLAYAAALAATITWGLFSNFTSYLDKKGSDKNAMQFFMIVTALLFIPLLSVFPSKQIPETGLKQILELGFLTVSSSLGYFCWDIAMRKGNATLVTSASYLMPFLTALSICIFFKTPTNSKLWTGCIFVIAGAILSNASIKRDQKTRVTTKRPN